MAVTFKASQRLLDQYLQGQSLFWQALLDKYKMNHRGHPEHREGKAENIFCIHLCPFSGIN